ncbi:hypothetical protein [Salinilacihabitans rarus]|uniref:hypothetical protein n=1 Tax=Salinilacihabitans rarus TaxID=2961596 RepID=UPI0020C875A8|nr:hypothetical protein [Salinilacihabitans rarus]
MTNNEIDLQKYQPTDARCRTVTLTRVAQSRGESNDRAKDGVADTPPAFKEAPATERPPIGQRPGDKK